MLAGVAATGEEEFFSMISAGIFLIGNIPQNHSKLRSTGVGKKGRRELSVGNIQ